MKNKTFGKHNCNSFLKKTNIFICIIKKIDIQKRL